MESTKKESTNRNTGNIQQMDHPWNTLETVTTFDRGNNMRSTLCLDNTSENQANAHIVQRTTPSANILIESLIQQLCTMFEEDKLRRNKLYLAICDKLHELKLIDGSYNMIEFEPLRGQYQIALYKMFKFVRSATGGESILPVPSCVILETSRYRWEFQEISFIAGGGFGQVFKALHRLDGIEYAVKKVIVHSSHIDIITHQLKEVKTLAKLNHANIVPYKAAWIESTLLPLFTSDMPSTDHKSYRSNASEHTEESRSSNLHSNKDLYSRSSLDILFDSRVSDNTGQCMGEESKHECIQDTESDIIFLKDSSSSENAKQTKSEACYTDPNESYEESASHQELCTYTSNKNQNYMTLYIQMTLCEQTLEQWMHNRNDVTPQSIIKMVFQQILEGIDYIHTNNVVHHDIKPSNIFISGQLQVHLGDFGLACPQRETHHSVIGTRMYAAPEQLQGKCDRKSDVYSAGIVLIELLILTQTQMELSCIINCLKCGNIPEDFTIEQHKWARLIIQLIQEDPAKRPCTKQLLHDFKEDKNVIISELRNDLRDKDNKIQELEEEIALLKQEALLRSSKVLDEEVK